MRQRRGDLRWPRSKQSGLHYVLLTTRTAALHPAPFLSGRHRCAHHGGASPHKLLLFGPTVCCQARGTESPRPTPPQPPGTLCISYWATASRLLHPQHEQLASVQSSLKYSSRVWRRPPLSASPVPNIPMSLLVGTRLRVQVQGLFLSSS